MGAIAKYVDSLTPEKEDRLLTTKMVPHTLYDGSAAGCVVGVAEGCVEERSSHKGVVIFLRSKPPNNLQWGDIVVNFNTGCVHFGEDRIAAAIRMRILNNRARKQLPAPRREAVLA